MVAEIIRGKWQRARQPEQKEQRRREILEAAATLYDEVGFEGITLNGVARQTGLAKSNLYRYFESLEEILLHLLLADFDELLVHMDEAREIDGAELGAVSRWLAEAMVQRPRFIVLLTQMAVVLERNLSVEVGEHFKREIAERSTHLGVWLVRVIPSLEGRDIMQVMLTVTALATGYWPMANPSPVMEEVLAKPDLQAMRVHFVPAFSAALEAYLRGVMEEKHERGDDPQ